MVNGRSSIGKFDGTAIEEDELGELIYSIYVST
jgi:hypothetical protein